MICNHLPLRLFVISVCLVIDTVAIINGIPASTDQFPYQVLVERYDGAIFGGGIIGDQFILTVAHGVFVKGNISTQPLHILAGTIDSHERGKSAVIREVKRILMLKKFKLHEGFVNNDIAVLVLNKPLGLSSHRRRLKELKLPVNQSMSYRGKIADVAGWGWDWINKINNTEIGGWSDKILRYAETNVLFECQKSRLKTVLGSTVSQKYICAQIKQDPAIARGICYGDSGSPLVYNNTIIGVASTSPQYCSEKWIGAFYTRVAYFLDFVKRAMDNKEHDDILSIKLHHP